MIGSRLRIRRMLREVLKGKKSKHNAIYNDGTAIAPLICYYIKKITRLRESRLKNCRDVGRFARSWFRKVKRYVREKHVVVLFGELGRGALNAFFYLEGRMNRPGKLRWRDSNLFKRL